MNRTSKMIVLAVLALVAAWYFLIRGKPAAASHASSGSGGGSWWQSALGRLAGSQAMQTQVATGFGRLIDSFGSSNTPQVPAESPNYSADWNVLPASDYSPGGAHEGWT